MSKFVTNGFFKKEKIEKVQWDTEIFQVRIFQKITVMGGINGQKRE